MLRIIAKLKRCVHPGAEGSRFGVVDPSSDPSLTELRALADHATRRVALERRRIYLGRGDAQHLAELERIAAGATGRVRRAVRAARSRSA